MWDNVSIKRKGNGIMYSLFCTDENGFSYYDTIEVGDAVELADVWDIVTSMGDMWMEKNRTVVERTPGGEIEKNNIRRRMVAGSD